jgi:hypothetical protein
MVPVGVQEIKLHARANEKPREIDSEKSKIRQVASCLRYTDKGPASHRICIEDYTLIR